MFIDVKDLIVWQKAYAVSLDVYRLTQTFPSLEQYGLVSQLRRAVVSIPSNIAEGRGRGSKKDFRRFLQIARGSLEEVRTQLMLSKDLGYLKSDSYEKLEEDLLEIRKMLNSLINKISE